MATGYLVTLGDGSLDAGDYISGSQSTFTINTTLGTGQWTWTGVWDSDGQTYTNVNDAGTYYTGTDGNVYFIPDNWFTTSGDASVVSAPAYSAGPITVDGSASSDLIDGGFIDGQGDQITNLAESVVSGDGNDTIAGSGGADTLEGGVGLDYVDYSGSSEAVNVNLTTNTGSGGDAAGDVYAGIDGVVGSAFNDTISGYDGAGADYTNVLSGGAGDDSIDALGSNDTVYGGGGQDTLLGGTGDDTVYGDTDPNQGTASPVSITTANVGDTTSGFTVTAQNVVGGVLTAPSAANVVDGGGWFGAGGTVSDTDSGVQQQIAYDLASDLSETLIVDFDNPVNELSFTTYSLQTASFSEVGHYDVYNGGVLVGSSDFTDSTGTGNDTFNVSGFGEFDQIVFTAKIQSDLTDGSDYGISDITFTSSSPAESPAADSIDGGDGDDLIYGEVGGDTIGGGQGDDTIYGDSDPLQYNSTGGSNTVGSTFKVISLGNYADADSDETNGITDEASTLSQTYGGAGSELYNNFQTAQSFDSNADTNLGDNDNGATPEDIVIDGTTYNIDSTTVYNATVTFTDGTSGAFTAVVFQTTTGDVFLAPELSSNADNTLLTSKPIESVTLGTVSVADTFLAANRLDADYALPADAGTAADADRIDGGAGNDSIIGDAGNDTIFGADGADTILGGDGDDNLDGDHAFATGGADSIDGAAGNDQIIGDAGNDTLRGGTGDDTIYAGDDADNVVGDTGNDSLYGEAGDDTIAMGLGDDTAYGGAGDDVIIDITAALGNDFVDAGDGNDTIYTDLGEDTVIAGTGNDQIGAGAGDDTVYAGDGDDTVSGDEGNDLLYGEGGDDSITTGAGTDTVFGGAGDDTIQNGEGNDSLVGGDGNDSIVASGGDDTLEGNAGNDTLLGGADDDSLDGGTGDDTLDGGTGNDTLNSSSGNDSLTGGDDADTFNVIAGSFADGAVVTVDGSTTGNDSDTLNLTSWTAYKNLSQTTDGDGDSTSGSVEVLDASNNWITVNFTEIETLGLPAPHVPIVDGTASDDTMGVGYTDTQGDIIDGADGNDDTIYGYGGNDSIDAGVGNDTVDGGTGNDSLFGDAGNDSVLGGAGDDTLNVEFTLDNDTLIGGETGETNGDQVNLSGINDDLSVNLSSEDDGTITDGTNTTQFQDIEEFILGQGDDAYTGGSGNDEVYAQGGNDTLIGNAGDDTMFGEAGDDSISGGADDDLLFGGDGNDVIDAGTNNDLSYGEAGNDTLDGGTGNDTLEGGAGNDSLTGGSGDDTLLGGDGNDTLVAGNNSGAGDSLSGGAGDDFLTDSYWNATLEGGDGSDFFNVGYGTATVTGGEGGVDYDMLSFFDADDAVNLTVTGAEQGTYTDSDGDSGTFSEIEAFDLTSGNDTVDASAATATVEVLAGAGNDSVIGGSGDDNLLGESGSDTLDGGAGDDYLSLGADSDRDVVVLADGAGSDTIDGFDLTDSGDGTANDQLDVAGLTSDGGTTPVTTADVTVTDDGSGNAVLTFPGGESITLIGVAPTSVDDPAELVAIGIPDGRDYIVEGTAGNDYISVGYLDDPEGDLVDSNDNAAGNNDDSILAGDGNDTVIAALGNDTVDAGAGDDSARGGDGNDTLLGNTGNDTLLGEGGHDSLAGGAGIDSMLGGLGEDTLEGGDDADTILGEGGNDSIDGDLGDDSLSGGDNSDTVAGGGGADEVFGNAGNDLLYGGTENDSVYGGTGDDTMLGDAGDDRLEGWLGNDSMVGGAGGDYLDGASGDDTLLGQDGNDTLASGSDGGADLVIGGTGDDSLTTGDGNDTLEGGLDDDSMFGGGGDDLFALEDNFGNDTIDGWGTSETSGDTLDATAITGDVNVDLTAHGSAADPESGTISDGTSTATFADIENITLGAGNDSITGSDGNDTITISTGAGADTIDGGAGNDAFDIGAGDGADDTIVLADGDGDDTITGFEAPTDNGDGTFTGNDQLDLTGLTDAGGALVNTDDVTITDTNGDGTGDAIVQFPNGESITLVGVLASELSDPAALEAMGIPAPDYIVEGTASGDVIDSAYTGDPEGDRVDAGDNPANNNDDSILAGAGNDTISAGLGNDSIDAGTGDDHVFGEGADDTVLAGDGADTVFGEAGDDSLTGGLGNDSMLGGTGNDALLGEAGDDTLRGEDGNDTIIGGDGNDSAHGGNGDDSMSGGTGDDELHGWYGNDTIDGGEGNDYIDADLGADLATGGDGNDTIMGGFSVESDTLQGEAGDDSIDGQAGNDLIEGGTGDDTMLGSDGDDTFTLTDSFGNDTITGGETDETNGDSLDASAVTADTTLDLTAGIASDPESGTISDGTSTAGFSEIENITLGAGNDSVIGSTGAENINTGTGADTVDGGAGNDTFDIGTGDGATDTVVLDDGDGDDTVSGFEGPIDNGDGTFTGQDQIDTSGLTDADGNPVLVSDVTVGDDGSGNAVLNFPNGESITLIGVAPSEVTDHDALAAMGIAQSDYIVDGTAGNDVIDASYAGDPDGDFVDNLDSQTNGNQDSIIAGAGNDTVLAGDGNDTIEADEGDDSVSGGDGDDEIYGFEGNDTVDGGAGDDFINTRTSPGTGLPDEEYNDGGFLDYAADADPNNDRDSVIGGDGNDTILSGDDNDTVVGGLGADSVDAGFDDDTVTGGAGNDTLEGNEGDDTIDGGIGDDVIYGELSPTNPDYAGYSLYELENDGTDAAPTNNEDSLLGGDGNDTIYGQDDNDTLSGGSGDDLLDGGIDDDSLDGGTGADILIGGAGDDTITAAQGDTITGGDGDDYFTIADLGEAGNDSISITGGEGTETNGDTLYLGPDYSQTDLTFTNIDDTAGGLSGNFTMSDGTVVNFSEIENIICFTPGTRILTAHGERRIEELREGDMVVTRDHGLRPIRWIGKRRVPGKGRFAPVQLGVNALAGAREGLLVSPQHRILFTGYRAELLFGEAEVLVPAKHLIDGREVVQKDVDEVTYIHLMFDRHEVIYAEGIATESFHAGDVALDAVDEAAREELFAIFPELRSAPYRHGKTARTCLKAHEAITLKGQIF